MILNKIYKFFNKHWIFASLVTAIPAYWFSFVKFSGKDFGLVTSTDEMKPLTTAIFYALLIISLTFTLSKAYQDNQNEQKINSENEKMEKELSLRKNLLSSVDSICKKKSDALLGFIDKNRKNRLNSKNVLDIIIRPKVNIEKILDEISLILSNIMNFYDRNNIAVSIMYKYDHDEWRFFHSINMNFNLPVNDIVNNETSTVYQIIHGKAHSLFYPEKKVAYENKQYLPDVKDLEVNLVGSIICRDISITPQENSQYISAILCIST
ncbi:MAG: hypothetical protein N2749_02030 [Clostridia bacterium]|nr:hypothetical protein [Clostridia bacterium]